MGPRSDLIFASRFDSLAGVDVVEIDAAVQGICEDVAVIAREILPALSRSSGPPDQEVLDRVVELRVRIEHLKNHIADAEGELSKLIVALDQGTSSGEPASRSVS